MKAHNDILGKGEKGIAVNYGAVCLGQAGDEELWGTISVDKFSVIDYLHKSAAYYLGPNVRYEIRERWPLNYGRSKGLAWYRNESFDLDQTWDDWKAGPVYEGGYGLVVRATTPDRALEPL